MSKRNNEFPAMVVTKEILGIEVGTVIKFDPFSGKYVSLVEEEEIADDYFYSGSAIAIDPYIVQAYVGDIFTPIEDNSKEEIKPEESEPLPPLQEGDEIGPISFPEYIEKHALVIDCGCGHRKLLDVVQAPGLSFSIMAEDVDSCVDLSCPECKANLILHFAQETNKVDEPTKEESN